jgi:hypothetical protein
MQPDLFTYTPIAPVEVSSSKNVECKNILSLFDLTGAWCKPYKENGYNVTQIDLQAGIDIMQWDYKKYSRNHFGGLLAAVPCTDFALCGSKHFEEKDSNGSTYESMALTYKTLAIIQWFYPGLRFYVIENPASRIHKLCRHLGNVKLEFNPFQFAGWLSDPVPEQYAKKTWLWGDFKTPIPNEKPCILNGMERHSKVGGKSIETKNFRSKTPEGFAHAFFLANK